MSSRLSDTPFGDDKNSVHILDGAQAMSDGYGSPPFLRFIQGLLNHLQHNQK